jgi:P-type Ca2+ transporter type 2C
MSSHTGLSAAKVLESRRIHGANVLTPPERTSWWKLWLEKFKDPVIRILLIAAILSATVGFSHGGFIETVGIALAVLLATTIAFVNEHKAEGEFAVLSLAKDDEPVRVFRDEIVTTILKKDVVVGDYIIVEAGSEIPADTVVIESTNLLVNESSLTGESKPIKKFASYSDYGYDTPLYRGTLVVDGYGVGVVQKVGDATEIGRTAQAASEEVDEETPLNKQLDGLSKAIGVCVFGLAAALFSALVIKNIPAYNLLPIQWLYLVTSIMGLVVMVVPLWLPSALDVKSFLLGGSNEYEPNLRSWISSLAAGVLGISIVTVVYHIYNVPMLPLPVVEELLHYFMIAVTLIVVAVPEGLPMSVTLSLAYSVRRMLATNNLVRRMHACETIGAATVICSDKTGTLTTNQMSVYTMTLRSTQPEYRDTFYKNVAINSTAELDGITENPLGNPTEGALLLWLRDEGIDYRSLRDTVSVVSQISFSTEKKYMATAVAGENNLSLVLVKGAPEVILSRSIESTHAQRAELQKIAKWQDRGMRVLGFAYKSTQKVCLEDDDISDLVYLGYAVISDPVRKDVPDAIRVCMTAGIDVKIVTGDNVVTAKDIGRQIGLFRFDSDEQFVLTGDEFNAISDEELPEQVAKLKILSRARPADKMRLVKALKDKGEVVAVTGDGVNDAPALNHAHVGLAMGKTGTSVAKSASDIILLDDSFASIKNAILWGRSLYKNIQKFVTFQLTINIVACGLVVLGPFLNIKFPLTIIQMLWVNLIMDTFAALALATEPPDQKVMRMKPRQSGDFIITKGMMGNILGVGLTFLGVLLFTLSLINIDGIATPRELTLLFTFFVLLQFWNMFNVKCMGGSSIFVSVWNNKSFLFIAAIILFGQYIIVQFGGDMFRTVPLTLQDWGLLLAGTSVVLWMGEVARLYKRLLG